MLREMHETALRITEIVMKMGENLHRGFHDIFSPQEMPIQMQDGKLKRQKARRPHNQSGD
jgi:hypothetical protein